MYMCVLREGEREVLCSQCVLAFVFWYYINICKHDESNNVLVQEMLCQTYHYSCVYILYNNWVALHECTSQMCQEI